MLEAARGNENRKQNTTTQTKLQGLGFQVFRGSGLRALQLQSLQCPLGLQGCWGIETTEHFFNNSRTTKSRVLGVCGSGCRWQKVLDTSSVPGWKPNSTT